MAINIKDPETDRLARELAELAGVPITAAVRMAVQEQLVVVRARALAASQDLDGIIERGRARPILDARPAEEILGYDDRGLPE